MSKVALAKSLGLECYNQNCDEQFKDTIENSEWYEIIFEFNEKFFTIEQSDVEEETVEGYWNAAADKVVGKLLDFITMDKEFREYAY